MQGTDALSSNVVGLMGEPLEFTSATEFDSATISFQIDREKLENLVEVEDGKDPIDNLIILWYNEEEGIFEEMPTDRDKVNSTVSTTTTHFSQYLVVDSVKWYAAWNENLNNLRKMYVGNTTEYRNVHTIYLVDCSQGMSTDHPSLQLRVGYNGVTEENFSKYQEEIDSEWESTSDSIMVRWCKRSTICNNMLANKWDYDQAAVIQFSDRILRQSSLTNDMETLKQELIAFPQSAQGVADVNIALEAARSYIQTGTTDLYRIVIITNGEAEFDSSAFEDFPSHTSIAVVNLISTWMPDTLNDADWNGIATVYDTVSADDLTMELTTPDGHTVTTTTYNNADSDDDGIPNIVEQYGLKPNGQPIGTDYKKRDTDGDGLTDGAECGFVSFDAILKATSGYVKYVSCLSDPTLVDTDGDEFDDGIDPNRLASDVKITRLANPDYVKVRYDDEISWGGNVHDDTALSYGGNQSWFRNLNFVDTEFDNYDHLLGESQIKGVILADSGCGLIAACDTLVYLHQSGRIDLNAYWESLGFDHAPFELNEDDGSINYSTYMDYVGKMAGVIRVYSDDSMHIFGRKLPSGAWPFPTIDFFKTFTDAFNDAFDSDDQSLKASWRMSNDKQKYFNRIKRMLESNIPAMFAYYHEEQMLQLYVSSDANIYEIQYDENGNPRNRIDGHYMVITGVLEYSDEVAEIVGHKTMLEVSSWGEKFYIDFEDYSSALSPFANVLEIMEE